MNNVTTFFEQSELALASYGYLYKYITGDEYQTRLENAGMTAKQAEFFASTNANGWKILDQYTDDVYGSGASATVFEHEGKKYLAVRGTEAQAGDFMSDGLLALGVPNFLNPQYLALKSKIDVWMNDPNVLKGSTCTITGHSLGGYLALALKGAYADKITDVYMYNAPGVGGIFANVPNFMTAAFGSLNFPADGVWNIKGSEGLSVITGLGHQVGTIINMPIEAAPGLGGNNHSVIRLVDSLAVYSMLTRLDSSLDIEGYMQLLNAADKVADKVADNSLERMVDSLQYLMLPPDSDDSRLQLVTRNELYEAIYGLMNLGSDGKPTGIFASLIGNVKVVETMSVAANAQTNFGVMAGEANLPLIFHQRFYIIQIMRNCRVLFGAVQA